MKKLGEVADILGGYAFKSSELKKEKLNDEYLPVIKIGSLLASGVLENNDIQFHKFEPALSKYLIRDNDILVAMTGATVGKVAISNNENLLLNQRVGLIRAKQALSQQDFLKYLLLSGSFYKYCQQTAGGGAQGNISPSQVMGYAIPIPSMQIQKKIVERLDAIRKAQELCDQQIQKTEELFESLLIQIEKINGSKVKISDICLVKGGKRIPKGLTFSSNKTSRPYVRVADFKDNSVDINDLKYIDDLVFKKISNYIISKEDVYISIAGTTGLIGLIPDSLDGASLTENAAKLVIKNKKIISKEYLMYCLLIPTNQSSFKASTHSTSVGKLALFRIQNTNINLPTFQEQQKIVEKLEAVQSYKKLLLKQKALLKELFDSVLDKSMKGEMDN